MKTKKELKQAYKQAKPDAGVFQILNKENGRALIEGASNMISKWNRHRTELRFGSHRNNRLQADWNNFGEESFEFSIVSELELDEENTSNLSEEVKLLYEMVSEEMNIPEDLKY